VIIDRDSVDDEAVTHPDAQHVMSESCQEAIVEPGAEPQPAAQAIEGQTGNEHGADLIIWHDRSISHGLGVAVTMDLSGPSGVVDRQDAAGGRSPRERKSSPGLIFQECPHIRLTRHGIEDNDPSLEIERVQEAPKSDTHAVVVDNERRSIGSSPAP